MNRTEIKPTQELTLRPHQLDARARANCFHRRLETVLPTRIKVAATKFTHSATTRPLRKSPVRSDMMPTVNGPIAWPSSVMAKIYTAVALPRMRGSTRSVTVDPPTPSQAAPVNATAAFSENAKVVEVVYNIQNPIGIGVNAARMAT